MTAQSNKLSSHLKKPGLSPFTPHSHLSFMDPWPLLMEETMSCGAVISRGSPSLQCAQAKLHLFFEMS